MKIIKLTEMYLRERNLAYYTKIHFRFVARLFVKDMNISEIQLVTHESLICWREKVLDRNSSESTWNNYLRHFRILINYAAMKDIIDHAPSISMLSVTCFEEKPKVMRIEDLRKVIKYLKSERSPFKPSWFWVTMIRTFFYTGMRRRQLAGLRWEHVSFSDHTIKLVALTSKNKRSWYIPAPMLVIADLQKLRHYTHKLVGDDEQFGKRFVFDIELFNSKFKCEDRIKESTVSNFFKRLSLKTGIRVSAHRMRHTMATELASKGKYKELQLILGHANVKTTMKYIHPEMKTIRNLLDTLNDTGI